MRWRRTTARCRRSSTCCRTRARRRSPRAAARLNDADRKTYANDLSQQLDQLLGLANGKDGNGNYTFAGFQVNAQPFVADGRGRRLQRRLGRAQRAGRRRPVDGGERRRRLAVPRQSYRQRHLHRDGGDGEHRQRSSSARRRSSGGAATTGHAYQVNFNVAAGVTTYDVVDTTLGTHRIQRQRLYAGQRHHRRRHADDAERRAGERRPGRRRAVGHARACSTRSPTSLPRSARRPPTMPRARNSPTACPRGSNNLNQALENVMTHQAQGGAQLAELDSLSSINSEPHHRILEDAVATSRTWTTPRRRPISPSSSLRWKRRRSPSSASPAFRCSTISDDTDARARRAQGGP